MFGDRAVVGPEKSFTSSDLLQYAESLLKEARLQERKSEEKSNHYSWLMAKRLQDESTEGGLDKLRPLIYKMSPESCTSIAVKLDSLTEDANLPPSAITMTLKKLLEEQDSMTYINRNVMRAKGKKGVNKVHPELELGRQPTVSFIVEKEV